MREVLGDLIGKAGLNSSNDVDGEVLKWACPVPFFGDISNAKVATVGINPSNREFVDANGNELQTSLRRLSTLNSLGLRSWDDATPAHVQEVLDSCVGYFEGNPYRQWFDVLDRLLARAGYSYYGFGLACHLDLVAFATRKKWGLLSAPVKRRLLEDGQHSLADFISTSEIRVLVLNGMSVIREFEALTGEKLDARQIDEWTLPRASGRGVAGYSYTGAFSELGGVKLGRSVAVVGYNHNLQSSFGVTRKVMDSIGNRVGEEVGAAASNYKAS